MMRRLLLAAVGASLALCASPVLAQTVGQTNGMATIPVPGTNQDGDAIRPPAAAVVLLSPSGSPYSASGGGGSSSAANFTPNQVSVTNTATQIVAARTGRATLTIENTGTTPIYVGGAGVTTSTGFLIPGVAGASLTVAYTGALYGITGSGTAAVSEYETY